MFDMHAIERSCARTLSGLKTIVLIDPNDLQTQPEWNILPDVSALDFKPGKGAYTFHTSLHTARLEDDTDIGQVQGDVFTYRLSGFIRVIRSEVELLRSLLRNRRIHVVVTYKDDTQRVLPYIRLYAKGDSGARAGVDKTGYAISGVATYSKPAPYLGGTFDIIGGPPIVPDPAPPEGIINIVSITTGDPDYTYSIPDGMLLVAVYVVGSSVQEVSVGLTASGDELGGPIPLEASPPNNKATFETVLRATGSTNIYISGMVGTNDIEIWLIGS